ncbi:oligosaccharide flippase family protein [Vibrio fluvialis]|uniref:oligosaccharide flippase family protein n=1 Tax=Vibrio fluvialis TaxID=676 RepID=UPI00192CD29B|nr:oligosaccharide flippase family protein [Vibrio fluvialis]MBL4305212.1 oligosaccharide flippase family protein [Vibrio fluvialis]
MSLKKNIVGLASAQLFNYILPFIQFPLLIRVLGPDLFGLIMYYLSVIVILQVITDYGLEIYLTKKITEDSSNKNKLNEYLYQSVIVKSILIVICFILFLIIYYNTILVEHTHLSIIFCLTMIVNAFNPLWVFQSIEKTFIFARIIIATKIMSILLIYILIRQQKDYVLFGYITLLSSVLLNLTAYFIIVFKLKINPQTTSIKLSLKIITEGFEFFLSRASASIYVIGCSLFLGSFGIMEQVAIYGMAEKLYIAGCGVFAPVITAFIPYMNRTGNYQLFYKVTLAILLCALIGTLIGHSIGLELLSFIFGSMGQNAKPVLDVLLLALIFNVMGMMFGYPALMPIGKVRSANISVIYSGMIQMILFLSLFYFDFDLTAVNVAYTFLLSTIFTFIYRFVVFVKYK